MTRIEAEVFGVPYPLQKGWAHRHGKAPITQGMLYQLQEKIGCAKSSTAEKAQRGLDAVEGVEPPPAGAQRHENMAVRALAAPLERLSPIPGFVLRQARRYRARQTQSGI